MTTATHKVLWVSVDGTASGETFHWTESQAKREATRCRKMGYTARIVVL